MWTYLELFAGAGGLSMGLEAAGMHPVAHAEIEPHARAVLRHHWPDTPLHGDVTQVDWTQYAGQVDLVAGGSPCQDLSVAGKRAGLAGARSGLFYELIRAWEETGAPYCLWENVDGARSSNKGEDFAAVLSAFVGTALPVPSDGWRSSGVAAGPTGVAAWRVLDLQHFGPPQRRRRVFVVAARTGGADPAEILDLSEGGCRHPSPRQQSQQGIARGAAGGAGGSVGCMTGDVTHALTHEGADASEDGTGRGTPIVADAVLAFKPGQSEAAGGVFVTEGLSPTLQGANNGSTQVPAVLSFQQSSCIGRGTMGVDENTTALRPVRTQRDHQMICLASGQANAEVMRVGVPTLNTTHEQPIVTGAASAGRPRRLTPLECERLMGWPDRHTAQGVKEDGTVYALSDAARYRLCGNGVGTPVAAWIATRLISYSALCYD